MTASILWLVFVKGNACTGIRERHSRQPIFQYFSVRIWPNAAACKS